MLWRPAAHTVQIPSTIQCAIPFAIPKPHPVPTPVPGPVPHNRTTPPTGPSQRIQDPQPPSVTRQQGTVNREYVSAPGTRQAKFSPALVWPLELGLRTPTLRCGHLSGPSRTRGGFFDFEVGGHDGAYKGRVHVIVPSVGQKNGNSMIANSHTMCLCLGFLGLRRE